MYKIALDFFHQYKDEVRLLDPNEESRVVDVFQTKFVFKSNTVNWDYYPNYQTVESIRELSSLSENSRCYIISDSAGVPAVEVSFAFIGLHLDMINRICFDSWFVGIDFDWIIENHHLNGLIFTTCQ